jgi:hypothetical protein
MRDDITLPQTLIDYIGFEKKEFAIKASHSQPPKMSCFFILFGTFWLAFTSIFVVALLGPLFRGKDVQFTVNDVPAVAGPGNLAPIIGPAIFIGIFVLIGLILVSVGFYVLFKKGGYFVGTPTRMIHYHNGSIRSVDWEQFSGDIEITGNNQKGSITLGMRTGRMVSKKNGPDQYVPDTFYISGIQNAVEIEKICRQRIKENDPTPPATENNN